ncbi:MAG: DUF29 domain-containing protein [Limnothrix sp.]
MQTSSLVGKAKELYEKDFYLWIQQTSQNLSSKNFNDLDLENLIEEIEAMGRSEKTALASNLRILLMHLLKYKYQPEKRSNSWQYTIFEHRNRIQDIFESSPSLKRYYEEIFEKSYQKARQAASIGTGLPLSQFPEICPFTQAEILED